MRTEELRIGNLVYSGFRVVDVVDSIERSVFVVNYIVNFSDGENCEVEEINPIPITTKWLERLQFRKDDNGNYWVDLVTFYFEIIPGKDGFYPVIGQGAEISAETEQRVTLNCIKYIHELQNLYFALTGEELKIK